MIHFLKDLFNEHEFSIVEPEFLEGQSGFMAVNLNPSRLGFFLVLFKNEDVDFVELNELINQYFMNLKRLPVGYDKRMDKNFTLIICLKRAAFTYNETLNRSIFEVEEDPYHFRKLVLPYAEVEVQEFNELYRAEGITRGLYNLLNDKDKFYDFKKHSAESTAYHLTTRLFIKLPFLHYQGKEEELENLGSLINSRLKQINLNSLRDSALNFIKTNENVSLEEEITLINMWLEELDNE
ncbi:ABC-three component system middle component 1 [Paenibacillus amylolyticus]|uniref:ABC-three component system middle component 1 n=1 Tax=Paenibacillus amylolyticus TaxID=1451 RepID=UPI00324240BC